MSENDLVINAEDMQLGRYKFVRRYIFVQTDDSPVGVLPYSERGIRMSAEADRPDAQIVINGQQLSEAEVVTVQMAVQVLELQIREDGLGSGLDGQGREMAKLYLQAIEKIKEKM